ncbi:MAG: site-specific integrase [Mariniphaga sp.]
MKNKHCRFALDAYEGHEVKDGAYPVILYVKKDNRRKSITLPLITALNGQWNNKYQRFELDKKLRDPNNDKKKIVLHPERVLNNIALDMYAKRCDEIIEDFYEKKIDWTLNQFVQAFLNKSEKKGIEQYFLQHIEKLSKTGQVGNMICYQNALNMIKLYDKNFGSRMFNEIDLKYINGFHDYLNSERGCSGNTIKYYMRAIRALLNKAIEGKEASEITYPFGKNGYSVAKLSEETAKRYLPSEYLEKLKSATLETYPLNWSRNLFLFSYYCQGMSFVDMAALNKNSINFDSGTKCIVYKRQKTEGKARFIHIQISEQIQNILDWFKNDTLLIGDFLIPIVSIEGYKGEELYEHIRNRSKKFNIHLKKLADKLEFKNVKLTSYVSRHSYAMRLKESNVPEDVISEALGHKELSTTKVYLSSFGSKVIAEANRNL